LAGTALLLQSSPPVPLAQEDAPAPAGEAPAAEQPAAEQPTAEQPAAEQPAADPGARSGLVVVGTIDGEISLAQSAYVKRLVETAEAKSASALMIELNTFGGRVDAAVAIRDALLDSPVETAVFINRRAISAGALISLACAKIAISSGATIGAATPVSQAPGQSTAEPVEEKYVSYFRAEMRSTAETRGRDGDIAEAMVDAEKEVPGLSEKGKLLTLDTKSALEHGIADVEATSVEDALAKLGLPAAVETVPYSWSESLVAFLTSSAVATLLFMAMMLLGYLEYQTPGFGVFGLSALGCFFLLYFGHYMVNLAGWEELLLFLLGVGLLLVEIFALPGFGVAGILGILAVTASLVLLLMAGDWSDFSFENPFTTRALSQVALTLVLSLVTLAALIRWLPRSRFSSLGGPLVLTEDLETVAGYRSHDETGELVGRTGETLTALRPSGKATIDGKRWNVSTEGDFIDAGEDVRVLRSEPGRIVVRRASEG
jgi:membrane-bound serine protease (ClpP class)